jgi:hypothetical protein
MPKPSSHARIADLRTRVLQKGRHGSHAMYVAGCRCLQCRAGHSSYNAQRERAKRAGERNDLVDAAPAIEHLDNLLAGGVGRRSVAAASGVALSTIIWIRSGVRKRITRQTLKRILDVDAGAAAGGCRIPAGPTWKILDRLIADGFTKRQLAKWMGVGVSIQFRRDYVTAETATKVRRLAALQEAGKLRRDR